MNSSQATFLMTFVLITVGSVTSTAAANETALIGRTSFIATLGKGVRVYARSYYTSNDAHTLKRFYNLQRRS
jgi:hypothetical protein